MNWLRLGSAVRHSASAVARAPMPALANARVVTEAGVVDSGWLAFDGAVITGVGSESAPTTAVDLGGRWVLPGFVDVHVHGGGGHSVLAGDPGDIRGSVA